MSEDPPPPTDMGKHLMERAQEDALEALSTIRSLEIVLELARQNVCDHEENPEEFERQCAAIKEVGALAVQPETRETLKNELNFEISERMRALAADGHPNADALNLEAELLDTAVQDWMDEGTADALMALLDAQRQAHDRMRELNPMKAQPLY